jgi:alpha-methylacyl-CoA racemase
MLLADMGADVVLVDRADQGGLFRSAEHARANVLQRGRRSLAVNLKHPEGVEVVRRLADGADVFLEGFRPGVAERLGIGPAELCGRNPALIYGRMTGWGQTGPWAQRPGHDINYIAMAGPLAHIGRAGQPPTPPLNLVGDFGGGGLLLAFGIACALAERSRSGRGQVIDAAMVDGAALLSAPIASAYVMGFFHAERGTNLLDSGAPFYDVYETADGRWLSVGAIEARFYAVLVDRLGLADEDLPDQDDQAGWPELKRRFAAVIATRTLDEWLAVFEGAETCVAPVRAFTEVLDDPHLRERGTWIAPDGHVQPGPAPRFDRTSPALDVPPPGVGEHTDELLAELGFGAEGIGHLRTVEAVA